MSTELAWLVVALIGVAMVYSVSTIINIWEVANDQD